MGFNFKKAVEFVGYHRPKYERIIADMYYKKMEDDAMEPVVFNPPFEIKLGVDHGHATDEGIQGWWKPIDDDGENADNSITYYTKYKDGKIIEDRRVDTNNRGNNSSQKYDKNKKVIEWAEYYPNQKLLTIRHYSDGSTTETTGYYPSGRVEYEISKTNPETNEYIMLRYLDHEKKFLSSKTIYGTAKKNPKYNRDENIPYLSNAVSYFKYKIEYYAQTNNPIMIMHDDIHSGIKTTTQYDREGNITDRKEEESKYVP